MHRSMNWIAALAIGLATASVTTTTEARDSGAKHEQTGERIVFGIDREEYLAQARAALQGDPVIAERIGAIRELRLDDAASLAEPGEDVLVIDLQGNRGAGRVTARFLTVDERREAVGAGTLRMADGSEHPISGTAEEAGALGMMSSLLGLGMDLFTTQARDAVQRYPETERHLGRIERFELATGASMLAGGSESFVFDVTGSKGSGRIAADFITVDADTERLGPGTLTLSDGRVITFEGEAPMPGEDASRAADAVDMDATPFAQQAREAVQRYAPTARHLGQIESFRHNAAATEAAVGMLTFVFDVVGSKGSGRLSADFITVDADTERLGAGTLTLAGGRVIRFDGEAPSAEELARDAEREGPFLRQAREAVQRYPLTARHLGRIESFRHDTAATMDAPGMLTFVFDVVGSKGRGRVAADFITVDGDTERLGAGTLTLSNGRVIHFEGEPPMPGEQSAPEVEEAFEIPDDSPFVLQAREAVQRYPQTAAELGDIATFAVDSPASMSTGGMETFVFDIVGSKASGRLVADFITVDADTERLGAGTLTLSGGREIRFDGEAPFPQETAGEPMPESFAPQDSAFVRQAAAALRTHPQVRRHLGEVREARIDRAASWAMPGDQYAFDLIGNKGTARLEADFITVDADTERMGAGTLILADGSRISLDAR